MDDNKKFDFREREIHIYFLHETQEMELSFFLNKQNHKMVRDIGESMTKVSCCGFVYMVIIHNLDLPKNG